MRRSRSPTLSHAQLKLLKRQDAAYTRMHMLKNKMRNEEAMEQLLRHMSAAEDVELPEVDLSAFANLDLDNPLAALAAADAEGVLTGGRARTNVPTKMGT